MSQTRRRTGAGFCSVSALAALVGLAGLFGSTGAAAQTPVRPIQPAETTAPSQSERRDADSRRGPVLRPVRVPAEASPTPGDTRPLVQLKAVEIDGATTLPQDALAPAYSGRLGQTVSQADIVAIAAEVSETYRRAGFHLSRAIVPPQDLKRGRLQIRVIEGTIDDIVVRGDETEAFGVRRLLAPVAAERPSRLATLEYRLLLANDRPGLRVSETALDEIEPASGRFRLTVTVQTWRLYGAVGLDNTGSKSVGPWQGSAAAALNSIALPGDSLALSGSFAPGASRELRYGKASYDVPLGIDSLRAGVSASRSEVWPGDERRLLRTVSRADTYEARLAFAPVLSQLQSLWLTGSLGISDAEERNAYGRLSSDRIRLASLTADYKLHAAEGSWSYLSATYRRGLGLVDPKDDSEDWLSRGGASPRFSLLNVSFAHYQNLVDSWSLKLSAVGQVASGPLLSSQQYYLGGLAFGRGFESGWLAGDNAAAGAAELRYDRSLDLAFAKGYQLYVFAEGGVIRSYAEPKDVVAGIASVGAGVRLFVNDDLQLGLAVARQVATTAAQHPDRHLKMLFSLTNAVRLCPGTPSLFCKS
jgi:hemolysin activation/secretion protein